MIVEGLQKTSYNPSNRLATIRQLLQDMIDSEPSNCYLHETGRYDLIELYDDAKTLAETIDFVQQRENRIRAGEIGLTTLQSLDRNRQVIVSDDWHPCIDGNKVNLRLFIRSLPISNQNRWCYYIKLCAWGGDDFGVEIEKHFADFPSAVNEYNELLNVYNSVPDGADIYWFYSHEFTNA